MNIKNDSQQMSANKSTQKKPSEQADGKSAIIVNICTKNNDGESKKQSKEVQTFITNSDNSKNEEGFEFSMQGHNMQLVPRAEYDLHPFIRLEDESVKPEHSNESELRDYDINADGNHLIDIDYESKINIQNQYSHNLHLYRKKSSLGQLPISGDKEHKRNLAASSILSIKQDPYICTPLEAKYFKFEGEKFPEKYIKHHITSLSPISKQQGVFEDYTKKSISLLKKYMMIEGDKNMYNEFGDEVQLPSIDIHTLEFCVTLVCTSSPGDFVGPFDSKHQNRWGRRSSQARKENEFMKTIKIQNPFTSRNSKIAVHYTNTERKRELKPSEKPLPQPIKDPRFKRKNSGVIKVISKLEEELAFKSRENVLGIKSHRNLFNNNYASPVYESAQRLIKHNYKEIKRGYAQFDKKTMNSVLIKQEIENKLKLNGKQSF